MTDRRLHLRVLGPLEAEHTGVPGAAPDLGGPRQRAVLALLLVERGGVVSVDRLIEDLWRGEPPPRAIGALQAYVSNLRRALEPDRPPRAPAAVLVSAPPGYAVRLPADAVDAWRFEALLRESASAVPLHARECLEQALGLWRGPAYAEVADEPWAQAEAARLEELRLVARERLVEALLATGAHAEAVPQAQALTREQPLREQGWLLLATGLYASARQGEALATLREARSVIAEELGLDPSPALSQLEQDILAQRVSRTLTEPEPAVHVPVQRPALSVVPPLDETDAAAEVPAPREMPPDDGGFVGREVELLGAHEAAAAARRGTVQVLLVSGEAGAGKSALLDQIRAGLDRVDWLTAVGRCPEVEGAPPAWPWAQLLRTLTARAGLDDALRAELAPLLEDQATSTADVPSGRFRLHRAVAECLVRLRRPLLLVLDDLHRADAETLAILQSVTDQLAGEHGAIAGVLVVAAYRPQEGGDLLEDALAGLARQSPTRLRLHGLNPRDAARFVRQTTGSDPDPATLTALVERTGGNPFYLHESAKLLASEGSLVALSEVPEGVRDVLRRRLARLPELDVAILRLAAVMGRDVDVDVLIDAAGSGTPSAGEDAVLAALEAGLLSGLLTEQSEQPPGGVRFAHLLVQETLLADVPRLRRTRLHARIGEALERLRPHDSAALAYHYGQAQSPALAARAVAAAETAAGLASARYAHDAAAVLHRQALASMDLLPPGDPAASDEARAQVYGQLIRSLLWSGQGVAANVAIDEGLDRAARAGNDDLAITVLSGSDIPLAWLVREYNRSDQRRVDTIRKLLHRPDLDDRTRCRLLCVLVREDGPDDADRVRPEAEQAVELARRIGDPAQLAHALGVLGNFVLPEREGELRSAIAHELLDLGQRHDLPSSQALAHHLLLQAAGAQNDMASLRRHLEAKAAIADRFQLTQSADTCRMSQACLELVAGRVIEAETAYHEVTELLRLHGSLDADGIGLLALFTIRLTQGREGELVEPMTALREVSGGTAADALALCLAAAGRHEEAVAAVRAGEWPRTDFFQVWLMTLKGAAAVATGVLDEAPQIIEWLRPLAGQIAGLGTVAFAAGPVGTVLGDLSQALGRPEEARAFYTQAAQACAQVGAPVWGASALAALRRLEMPA